MDLGCPRRVQLAVLIDRGHRELPIQADYVGKTVQTEEGDTVEVSSRRRDGEERVVLRRGATIINRPRRWTAAPGREGERDGISQPERPSQHRTAIRGRHPVCPDTAEALKEISSRAVKKVPTLRGKTVINLFFEPSTRTRSSFELAEKRLSADILNFSASASSVTKGETLLDTARNLEAMSPDIIVIRHSSAGAPHLLGRECRSSVVNAGDGMHEHPTQALLDALTVRSLKGRLEGWKIAIIGDISHSRVARSDTLLFHKMGAEVWVCGPRPWSPRTFSAPGSRASWRRRSRGRTWS